VIVAEVLTDGDCNDAKTALDLIDEVKCDVRSITADAAYDTLAIYDAAAARRIEVVVPVVSQNSTDRDPDRFPKLQDNLKMTWAD